MNAGLTYENEARRRGYRLIAGVDEAGRGPLAGPVVAAAVALKRWEFESRIDDSKKISLLQREKAFHEIHENGCVGVGIASEAVVDEAGIVEATHHAMGAAVAQLVARLSPRKQYSHRYFRKNLILLIDGRTFSAESPYPYRTIIRGDSLSLSIACASIVAKVTRARILDSYDKIYPGYGFKDHKGYGTAAHKEALRRLGPSLIHRKTYRWRE